MLDLFAGTGAVGIEALSRGARHVTFLERAANAIGVLRRNLEELELLLRARVLTTDARRGLARLRREGVRFDLVFADPPYDGDWAQRLVREPALVDLLAPAGILVVERARSAQGLDGDEILGLRDSRSYGSSSFDWYEPTEVRGE